MIHNITEGIVLNEPRKWSAEKKFKRSNEPQLIDPQLPITSKGRCISHLVISKVKCKCTGTVLIIDDNQFNLETAKLIIEKNLGLECDLAQDGEEGYMCIEKKAKCLSCKQYKFVLIDINMPVMNGIDLIKKLRYSES